MGIFKLDSPFGLSGDQSQAVAELTRELAAGRRNQTLLGVTGSGKTFTMANVIAAFDRPVLVLSHNKTLAAQLYSEFKSFFPANAVEYFISYYDYYLPESYIPQTDTYIAKDASINENIEKLRLSTTASLLERRDVIVVASVSSIYSLGAPQDYRDMCLPLAVGESPGRNELLRRLIDIQYDRNDTAPEKGQFRVRGDSVDIFEPHRDKFIRVEFWGDEIEALSRRNMVSGALESKCANVMLFPCKHFVTPEGRIEHAAQLIRKEMLECVSNFEKQGKLVEAQRLYQRVIYDLEMMKEIGYCSGIENYSRYLSDRAPGNRPYCLLDFFDPDFITIIDESHVTLPQIRAMYKADRSRKQTLIDHGFRLPSALDNRPLKFEEFESLRGSTVFVSATPSGFEMDLSGRAVEQLIRPTGLLDPEIELKPLEGQVDDVIEQVKRCREKKQRVIVTTLTKKSSERLAEYLQELKIRADYLHSELDAIERVRTLSRLRSGDFDCLIGVNLLREGIDLPEVAMIAILDADKAGFLRSETSLIQIAGRAARNVDGKVILYADNITPAIKKLIDVTNVRREKQMRYNQQHNITPKTIENTRKVLISDIIGSSGSGGKEKSVINFNDVDLNKLSETEMQQLIHELEKEMFEAAEALEFERAAHIRDQIKGFRAD